MTVFAMIYVPLYSKATVVKNDYKETTVAGLRAIQFDTVVKRVRNPGRSYEYTSMLHMQSLILLFPDGRAYYVNVASIGKDAPGKDLSCCEFNHASKQDGTKPNTVNTGPTQPL
jgi:hypothetical protein